MAKLNGAYSTINVDFRPFVNRMRYLNEKLEKSVTSPEVREVILQRLAKVFVSENNPPVTKASHFSLVAVQTGRYIKNRPMTGMDHSDDSSKNKLHTRTANGYFRITSKTSELVVDPIDEKGRHYGLYSIDTSMLTPEAIKNELYGETSSVYKVIYYMTRKVIAGR